MDEKIKLNPLAWTKKNLQNKILFRTRGFNFIFSSTYVEEASSTHVDKKIHPLLWIKISSAKQKLFEKKCGWILKKNAGLIHICGSKNIFSSTYADFIFFLFPHMWMKKINFRPHMRNKKYFLVHICGRKFSRKYFLIHMCGIKKYFLFHTCGYNFILVKN